MTEGPTLARDLRLAVGRVARRLRQIYAQSEDQLGFLELAVLQRLDRSGPANPGALAQGEQVTSAAIAAIVGRLVAVGLVEREADPDDGRRAIVTISGRGRTALAAREAASVFAIQHALDALTPSERQTIADAVPLLERMATLL